MEKIIQLIKQPSSAAGGGLCYTAVDGFVADGRFTWLRAIQLLLGIIAIAVSEGKRDANVQGKRESNTTVAASVSVSKVDNNTSA